MLSVENFCRATSVSAVILQTGQLEPLVSALSDEEEEQMKNMLRRIDTIAKVRHHSRRA